jgi:hypothetical protein
MALVKKFFKKSLVSDEQKTNAADSESGDEDEEAVIAERKPPKKLSPEEDIALSKKIADLMMDEAKNAAFPMFGLNTKFSAKVFGNTSEAFAPEVACEAGMDCAFSDMDTDTGAEGEDKEKGPKNSIKSPVYKMSKLRTRKTLSASS